MKEKYKDTRLAFSVHVHCSKCYKAFNSEVPSHNCEGIYLCPFDTCGFKIINVSDNKENLNEMDIGEEDIAI